MRSQSFAGIFRIIFNTPVGSKGVAMLVYFGTTIIILAAIYMLIELLLGAKAGILLWIVMVIVSIWLVAQMVS